MANGYDVNYFHDLTAEFFARLDNYQLILEHPVALLNTSALTTNGDYTLKTITLDYARSTIGHESTAPQILSNLLGKEIPNRQQFEQKIGQVALVFKLNGRPLEGKILTIEEIENIGYTFKLLVRKS